MELNQNEWEQSESYLNAFEQFDLLAHFIASSYLSLLTWWLNNELPYTPEHMDRLFQQLVIPGVHQIIDLSAEDSKRWL
jgi:hypothetical protein